MGIFLAWIIFAFVVGAIGSDRKIGFWGAFLLSLLLSPIIGLIIALVSDKKSDIEHKLKVEETQKQQIEVLTNMSKTGVADELKKLKELVDTNVITKEEYELQKQKILS